MEFGDIVYLILIVAFMIFGFFKEIRKKNRKIDESTEPVNTEFGDVLRDIFQTAEDRPVPPPAPSVESQKRRESRKEFARKDKRGGYVFQSSMDLVTDFERESSLKGYSFKEHLNEESLDRATLVELHPVLDDLTGENRSEELQKAIVYSEIIKRKY